MQHGENHSNAKLKETDVIEIRTSYNNRESKRNVFKRYEGIIGKSGFHKIWNGYTWTNIMMEVYTDENKLFHKNNTGSSGENNPRALLNEKDVKLIRKLYLEGESLKDISNLFKDKVKYQTIYEVAHNISWKHVV